MEIGALFDAFKDSSNELRNVIGKQYPKISGSIASIIHDAKHSVMIMATYESVVNNESEIDEKTISMIKNTFKKGSLDDFFLEYEIIFEEIENTEFENAKVFSHHRKFFYTLKNAIQKFEEEI